MYSLRRPAILFVAVVIFAATVSAQTGSQRREMTVEESYLMESIEIMIIRETARSHSREQKMRSLDYIGEALDRGNKSDEIRQTLEELSMEGRRTVARERGRIVNNFPEVRRQAVRYLGQVGTEEARRSLILVLQSENEPMVLQEAIKSLGNIGTNVNNETVANICWIMDRNINLNPDNVMALETINALEKIARKNGGLNSPEAIQTLLRISEGLFINPVKNLARQLLADMRSYR